MLVYAIHVCFSYILVGWCKEERESAREKRDTWGH